MSITIIIICCVLGFVISYGLAIVTSNKLVASKISDAEQNRKSIISDAEQMKKNIINDAEQTKKNIINDAENEAKNLKKEKILEAKEEWHKRKQEFDKEANVKNAKLQEYEKNIKKQIGRAHV